MRHGKVSNQNLFHVDNICEQFKSVFSDCDFNPFFLESPPIGQFFRNLDIFVIMGRKFARFSPESIV